MLYIYIPALISLLNIECNQDQVPNTRLLSNINAHRITLHDQSLRKLTEIGPKFPDEFKQIMSSSAAYSESLKSAIRNQQRKVNNEPVDRTAANKPNPESIKLKVDFSNYK